MLRTLVHVVGVADLDDLAEVHHRDLVADVAHHREVVRDEHVREPELVLQVLEQVHDAGLDRHVERRHRLVEHQQLGLEQRHARAMPMRWRCPPENSCGNRFTCSGFKPDERHELLDPLRARCRLYMPWIRIGSLMIEPTVMRGLSDAYGSWKTICILRRSARRSRRPSSEHFLAAELHRARRRLEQPQDQRPVVVLPQPDSPTKPERLARRAPRSSRPTPL